MADDTDLTDKLVETAAEPAEAGVAVGSFSKDFWQHNQPLLAWPFRYGRLLVRWIAGAVVNPERCATALTGLRPLVFSDIVGDPFFSTKPSGTRRAGSQ